MKDEFDTIKPFDFQNEYKVPSTLHSAFREHYPEFQKVSRKDIRPLGELLRPLPG
jgi:hypothetical protein